MSGIVGSIGVGIGLRKLAGATVMAGSALIAASTPVPLNTLYNFTGYGPGTDYPNLGNFEGQCPSVLFGGYPDEPLAAIDALRPDQQALLADHVAAQRVAVDGARRA